MRDPSVHQPSAAADASVRSGRDRRWWLVVAVVGLPVVVLVLSLATRTWYPTGDQAQAELRMLSLPERPPLVGAAGRIVDEEGRQGNHPGPLMFWATWPLYVVLGRSSWAFESATALVNLAWLSTSVWLVRRRAGLAASAWYGVTALVLIGGYGLDGLSQPWNPWVSLLPFTVLILATWSTLERDRWAPVLAVAAGSYALQGHAGYAPVTLPLVAVALAAPVWRWFRGHDERRDPDATEGSGRGEGRPPAWLAPLLTSIGVGLVAWSGPLYDAATNDPSNLDKLVANFATPSEDPIGIGRAIEAVLQSADPLGPWVWGGAAVDGSILPGIALVVAWAAVSATVALRRTDPSLTRLNAVLALVLCLGVLAVSRVFGALFLYVFRWIVAIVALQVFALGWGLATLLPAPHSQARRRLAGLAVVVLVGLSVVTAVRLVRQEIPYDQSWKMEQVLAPAVADELDPNGTYLVRWDDPAYLGGLGFGLVLDLERRGFDVGGDPRFSAAIEPHRVLCPGEYDAVVLVATGDTTIASYAADPAWRQIAAADPRPDGDAWAATYADLLAVVQRRDPTMTAEGLERTLNLLLLSPDQPQEVTDLAAELVLTGVPSAVFLQEPAAAPPPLEPTPLNEPCWR